MNRNNSKEITVDDFDVICRICLQVNEDMLDIFTSGIKKQLMEVTNLKMELDDKLPKMLCLKCTHQLNQLFIFLQQAKSSDFYLKSLLSKNRTSFINSDSKVKEKKDFKKKISGKESLQRLKKNAKILKSSKNDTDSDKMYLIFVPEVDNDKLESGTEIHIKDLNSDNDNFGLINYCRTLVRNQFSDHTYPKEPKDSYTYPKEPKDSYTYPKEPKDSSDEDNNQKHHVENTKSIYFSTLGHENYKIYKVNFHVYECIECLAFYEEFNDLTAHFLTHDVRPDFKKHAFSCPVCGVLIEEKVIFLNHLKTHKDEGVFFVKVNAVGEIIPAKENKDLFFGSFEKNCKVISLNLDSLTCIVCSENIQPKDNISDHLQLCLSKEKSEIKFNIKYQCPICCKSFSDEEINFIKHLKVHKKENCYFVKVDSSGKPVQLVEGDELFIPFEEALKIFYKNNTVFKIIDINSCDECDYRSDYFNELYEHCNITHSKNISPEILFCCPVCLEECKGGSVDENLTKFYDHLKLHRNEGVTFILVKKNGTLANVEEKHLDIFTQSLVLFSLVNSALLFQNISPELVILDNKNFSAKYTCDLCKEHFKRKQEVISHVKSYHLQEVVQDKVHFICEKCGKKCSGKLSYKKHFLKHTKSLSSSCRRPICMICNKTFASRASLNGHIKHHLKEGKGNEIFSSFLGIICEKCGKSFSNSASLTKHKKMHLKEKENNVLKCEICDREFFRQSSFDRHKSAHLNPKYFECGVCKLPLSSVVSLQKHSETHKSGSNTFDCKACKLSFLTKDSLTAHQTHTGHYLDRQPLECNVCHEKFFIGKKFTEHIKTHPKYKMGECTLCGKRLSTIQSLMLHMGRHFESNSILCPHCGKQFFEERNYHRHLLTHEGIKPFSCDSEGCKKSFYTLFELNRHKKYHNNTRDFRCAYCCKSFHEANHLTVHVRTHTGERPYACPHCNKSFVTRTHCKHHIKLMHQGVGYDLIRSSISKKVTVFEAIDAIF